MKTAPIMKCVFCGGKVEAKMITLSYEKDDKYHLVENVPAEVCTNCGEKMYSPEIIDELLKFAHDEFKPVKTGEVSIFDFAERT